MQKPTFCVWVFAGPQFSHKNTFFHGARRYFCNVLLPFAVKSLSLPENGQTILKKIRSQTTGYPTTTTTPTTTTAQSQGAHQSYKKESRVLKKFHGMGCREPLCTTKPLSETAKSETAKEPPEHQSQRFSLDLNTKAQEPGLTRPRFKDAPLPVGCSRTAVIIKLIMKCRTCLYSCVC